MAILSEEVFVSRQSNEWSQFKVLDDTATDETTSSEVDIRGAKSVALHVEASAGVNGGVVKLEAAPRSGYTGTWMEIGTVTTNAASKLFSVSADLTVDGLPARVARARVETAISSGSVDIYITVQR